MNARAYTRPDEGSYFDELMGRHASDGVPELELKLAVCAHFWPPTGGELPPEAVCDYVTNSGGCYVCCCEVRNGACGCCECDRGCSCDGERCRCGNGLCASCAERKELIG